MKKLLLVFCLILGLVMQLQAQDKWLYYSNKDSVTATAVEDGKIWICSNAGVVVRGLNGEVLADYTFIDGLVSNDIFSIVIDSDGNKWFGTNRGVSKFDGTSWTNYTATNSGLVSNHVRSIAIDVEGNKWFGTNNGVSVFDGTSWTNYTTINSGLSSNQIFSIAVDGEGNKWFGTYEGVSMFDGTSWTSYTTTNSGLVSNSVISIAIDLEGNKWFVGDYGGVSMFDGTSWTTYTTINSGLSSNYITDIVVDKEGAMWFCGGYYGGVSQFDGTTWITYNSSNSGLYSNSIYNVAIDKEGNKWFGTTEGVLKFDGNSWLTYSTANLGLVSNFIGSIAIDVEGNKWFGTGAGVSKFDGTTWTNYTVNNSGLVSNSIGSIAIDVEGNKWFGTGAGVSKFDGTTWTNYTVNNSGLVSNSIGSIAIDVEGNKWFGTYGGISMFDGTTWTNYTVTNSGLVSNYVQSIAIDVEGNKWFGTYEGVSMFDGTSWTSYTATNSGLVSNYVQSIAIDAEGNKWFGTYGGVSKFDSNNWLTYTTTNSSLSSNRITDIAVDKEGNKWFSGGYSTGVSKFDGTTWTTYNNSNSELYSNYVQSIAIDVEGNKWFGANEGVFVLSNTSTHNNPVNKSIITSKIFLDKNKNQLLDAGEGYVKGQKVLLNPGNVTAYTNTNGEYRFQADSGKTYTVSYVPSSHYTLTKDTSYTFTLKNEREQLSPFAVFAPDTLVYQSNISLLGSGRCNTEVPIWFTYTNSGTTTNDAALELTLDVDVAIKNSFPAYDSLVANKIYYSFTAFDAGTVRQIKLNVQNPTFERMGDTLVYSSNLLAEDKTFTETAQSIVTCSYDPNDKAVLPLPIGEENYTLKNEVLKYTIRFQNTGNDTAFYVAIKDTLHSALDRTTFTELASSHPVNTTMSASGEVTFEFNNIVLPDSATNEEASNGFVSYSIQAFKGVPENTLVSNTAYIYFDQNPAIITNTTLNNLVTSIPINVGIEENIHSNDVNFYPNPLSTTSMLKFKNTSSSEAILHVQELSGKVLFSKTSSSQAFTINKSDFNTSGLFIYTIHTATALFSGKLIVE